MHGDDAHARLYQAVADDFQRTVKGFTVTHNGPYSAAPYFIRLSKNGDPNSEFLYGLGNGSVNADQRAVVDGGFQELVRLGELPADDADVQNSLKVLDQQLGTSTPTGTGYYRYGTSTDRQRGRVRRLLHARPDHLPAATASPGRPPTPDPATCGRCCPVSAPSPPWPPATPALARTQLGFMLGLRLRGRSGPGAGLGGPRPGRLAVRERPDHRVDRLPRRSRRPARPRR